MAPGCPSARIRGNARCSGAQPRILAMAGAWSMHKRRSLPPRCCPARTASNPCQQPGRCRAQPRRLATIAWECSTGTGAIRHFAGRSACDATAHVFPSVNERLAEVVTTRSLAPPGWSRSPRPASVVFNELAGLGMPGSPRSRAGSPAGDVDGGGAVVALYQLCPRAHLTALRPEKKL